MTDNSLPPPEKKRSSFVWVIIACIAILGMIWALFAAIEYADFLSSGFFPSILFVICLCFAALAVIAVLVRKKGYRREAYAP